MEGGFIARRPPAVASKWLGGAPRPELTGFWPVLFGVVPAGQQLGYTAEVLKLPWLCFLRSATLVALCASTALLSDYIAGTPTFCSAASGCGAVRASAYSHFVLGDSFFIPLPALGLLGFAVLMSVSFVSRALTRAVAGAGGLIALCLLLIQAVVVRHFCWLCVSVDLAALVAAVSAFAADASAFDGSKPPRLRVWVWWALSGLSLAAPLAWPAVRLAPPVPVAISSRYRPGKINVIEFADFECPACRRFAGILKQALAPYGDRVHFERLNKPLEMHPAARDLARAYVCALAQDHGEPMAEALFAAEDLSPVAVDQLAVRVGLDPARFASCMLDPKTNQQIERESSLLGPPEFEGLPTTYIGGKRLLGVQSVEVVTDALERAARAEGSRGLSGYVYVPLVALLGLLCVRLGLRRKAE